MPAQRMQRRFLPEARVFAYKNEVPDETQEAKPNDDLAREHADIFARSHCSAAVSLLARWPEIPLPERSEYAKALYTQLLPEMDRACTHSGIDATGRHRGDLLMRTLLNAIGVILGQGTGVPSDAYLREKDRLRARAEQVAQLLIDGAIDGLELRFPIEAQSRCIPVWGQHGAHFPDYKIADVEIP